MKAKAIEIQQQITALRARIAPLNAEIAALERQHRDAVSREWIAAQKLKLEEVERSSGDDKPWFGHIKQFADWLNANNCQKPFCEWNGCLYPTKEIIAGHMRREAPGLFEHLST